MQEKIKKLFEYDEKMNELISQIDFKEADFEVWEKFCPKTNYKYTVGINNPLGIMIDKYLPWIRNQRYRVLDLELILFAGKELVLDKRMTEKEFLEIKDYLKKINFGTMIIDW